MGKRPLPAIVDDGYEKLAREYRTNNSTNLVAGAAQETEKIIRRKLGVDALTLEGRDAAEYLTKLISLAEEEIVRTHSAYGHLRWLWYLRRAPSELFEGRYKTTLGYDRALAEAIAWQMPDSKVQEGGRWIRYPIDRSIYRRLCQYIGRIKLISSLHIMYRRVGKGGKLDLSRQHIEVINDDASDAAIEIYDQRHDKEQAFLGRGYGLSPEPFDIDKMRASAPGRFPHLWFFMPCRPIELPIDRKVPGEPDQQCVIKARHIPWTVDAQGILDPLQMGDDWEQTVLRPFACAVQLSMSLPLFLGELEWGLGNCLKVGYFVAHEARAEKLFNSALPEINEILSEWFSTDAWPKTYSEWREASLRFSPNTWPLEPGGFVRLVGEVGILIDTVAMSLALDRGLGIDRSQSKIANMRADLFERQCQTAINRSLWEPTADLAYLRGKTLRRNGLAITDIDAIGSIGETILCISCKSLVYDAAYDRGDFNVVQNAKRTVNSAVEHWSILMEEFRQKPQGDNFDFSAFSKIIGLVCTPYVVYTDNQDSLREIAPGLLACASVNELQTWLNEG